MLSQNNLLILTLHWLRRLCWKDENQDATAASFTTATDISAFYEHSHYQHSI